MSIDSRWPLWVAGLLSLSANIISLVQYGTTNSWIYIVLPAIATAVFIFFALRGAPTFWAVRRLMAEAQKGLYERGVTPKRIITFDRSSAIFGGILAQRMNIAELVALPRRAEDSVNHAPRKITVGAGLSVDGKALTKDAVAFVYHLRTGGTLEAGLRALGPNGSKIPVIALYATPGAQARWPNAIVIRTTKRGHVPNEHLPWMSTPYKHE